MKDVSKPRKSYDTNYLRNIKDFFSNKKLHLPYIMATGVEVWWSLVYIYVPLFMIKNNLSDSSVALFFSLIIVPLVILENKVGNLSSKKGFRFFFVGGFLGLVLISLFLFFTSNIIYQLVLIVIGSVFVSFLEPIQDTFFFKQVLTSDEEKYYPLFSSSADLGGFLGKFVIAAFLLFLPNKYAYASMFFMMLFFVFMALRIPKNKK
ncbi:hypothetical protein JXA48_04825 [Candidatus Woesearchaeota archaeon]|nr:hypothetical protein [Candidatus Woesearchaeota archaeon]